MIGSSSQLFHNVSTAASSYMDLSAFKNAVYSGKVRDFSVYSHEARWIKSQSELSLMRNSASIGCQVYILCCIYVNFLSSALLSVVYLFR